MRLFFFYPQGNDVGETYSLVPATVTSLKADGTLFSIVSLNSYFLQLQCSSHAPVRVTHEVKMKMTSTRQMIGHTSYHRNSLALKDVIFVTFCSYILINEDENGLSNSLGIYRIYEKS
jgi:hypothetical protein